MLDIDNNKLTRFVNNFWWWFVTKPRTYIKKRRKRRQWVRFWIRKTDNKGADYSIINDLRLKDKEDFRKKICKKLLAAIPIL